MIDFYEVVLVFSRVVVVGGVVRYLQEWVGFEGGGVDVVDRDQIWFVLVGWVIYYFGGIYKTGF